MQEANWELILHRLDDLTKNQELSSKKLDTIQEHLNKLNAVEKSVSEVIDWKVRMEEKISISELNDMKEWKSKMDEIVSPKQLDKIIKEHDNLKTFKTKATMIWVIVQAIMVIATFIMKFL